MTENEAIKRVEEFGLHHAIGDLPYSTLTVKAFEMAIKALEEIQQYRAIGTVEECREARETAPEHVEVVKLIALAAICYAENLRIIKDRMKDSKEARDIYMQMSVVQQSCNSAALERLAGSGIDVNGIRNIEEISRILFPCPVGEHGGKSDESNNRNQQGNDGQTGRGFGLVSSV